MLLSYWQTYSTLYQSVIWPSTPQTLFTCVFRRRLDTFFFWLILDFASSKLTKELGAEKLSTAYNYLKKIRYDDRDRGTEVDEKEVMRELSKIIPGANTKFDVEYLLVLEMRHRGLSCECSSAMAT